VASAIQAAPPVTPGSTVTARNLVAATAVSGIGDQITTVAFAFLAVTDLHASAFAVAALVACNRIPFPLLGLPVGVLVDRLPRRRLLVISDVARSGLVALIPLLIATHRLGMAALFAVAFGTGAFSVVFDVAKYSWVPSLVGNERIARTLSQIQVAQGLTQVIGPAIAGVALVLAGPAPSILIDCASFLLSAALIVAQHDRFSTPRAASQTSSAWSEIGAGIRFVAASPLLRSVLGTTSLSAFAYGAEALFSVVALRSLHLSASGYGLLISCGGLGWLIGSAFASTIGRRYGLVRTMTVARCLEGAALAAMLLLQVVPSAALAALLLFFMACSDSCATLCSVTLRQLATPDALRGRVNSIFRAVFWGMIPLGNLALGALAMLVGTIPAIGTGGIIATLAGLAMASMHLAEPQPEQVDKDND
jgi:MFS family permease